MKKFLVIYRCGEPGREKMKNSAPEEHKKSMEAWFSWKDNAGDSIVDFGNPIGQGDSINGSDEFRKDIIGYSILQAEDTDSVREVLKDHPHIGWDDSCSIDILECMNMPSM